MRNSLVLDIAVCDNLPSCLFDQSLAHRLSPLGANVADGVYLAVRVFVETCGGYDCRI